MTTSEVQPPPVPVLGHPWRVRPVRPRGADLLLVTGWMNAPHVASTWHQAWPVERWETELAGQLHGGHSVPCLVERAGEPVAYVEIYRPARVALAAYYPAERTDLGVHIAIGDPANTGRGIGSTLLREIATALLAADPHCTRVVAEPDVTNHASVHAFGNAGFAHTGVLELPHKVAALLVRSRQDGDRNGRPVRPPATQDVVGVGFGPANLALAVAIDEQDGPPMSCVFAERQTRFGWHRDMLIDGATVQVSFLKDLVTLRNPTSPYSFVAYLHAKGRLPAFVNHKTLYPSRTEFNDYLTWVANHFADQVAYGTEVVGLRPVREGDRVGAIEVATDRRVLRTRNVVLAPGLRPALPPGVTTSDRIWHSDELLSRAPSEHPVRRAVVVGAGQSAAEAVEHLHSSRPDAEVCAVFTRYGYSPADDSPFVNAVFDAAAVDEYFDAPDDVKRLVLDYHANTNYSVVDLELIDELYRRSYQEKVTGRERLRLFRLSRVRSVVDTGERAQVEVESLATGDRTVLDADLVVFATGYREADVFELLGEVAGYCLRDACGRPLVSRDYRVATVDGFDCGIYLQGPTEHSHGLGSGLLSNIAVRAGEIAGALRAARAPAAAGQPPLVQLTEGT